jgi:hypothetical protein
MFDLSLQGKHVWLNASTQSELRNQLMYFQSEYEASPVNTSGCILLPLRCYFRFALSKGWRELMSIPKGSMVRRRMSDGSLSLERSTMPLQILYLVQAANEMLATMAGSSAYYSVVAASLENSDKSLKMLFAGQAAGVRANILFDSGATQNFVSESFARQTGISVHPTERVVKLGSDQEVVAKGEANVYMRLGSVQQAVKCAVMPLLFGVDVILGQQFMTSHKCILDFDRMCVLLRKGR